MSIQCRSASVTELGARRRKVCPDGSRYVVWTCAIRDPSGPQRVARSSWATPFCSRHCRKSMVYSLLRIPRTESTIR